MRNRKEGKRRRTVKEEEAKIKRRRKVEEDKEEYEGRRQIG